MKYEQAYNSHDPVAVAALYTEDGSLVTTHNGVKHGREAIAKHCEKIEFQLWHANNLVKTIDRAIAVADEIRVFGRWNCSFKDDAYTLETVLNPNTTRGGGCSVDFAVRTTPER